jgi:uncharacterized protein
MAQIETLNLSTVYGPLAIDDPLAVDLILSPSFQRLKGINQYGVVKYITPTEEYTRFDHSLGVYHLLKMAKASRDEQIAGLLHDVSHTVFSHVGDYVFQDQYPGDSYQDDIHLWYLAECGIDKILKEYGVDVETVNHKRDDFLALDRPLPHLCADRIEYNLQGGLLRGILSKEEFEQITSELDFAEGQWSLKTIESALALGRCSLVMTKTLWGAAWEALSYRFAAEALRRSFEIRLVTFEEFHFSTDDAVWEKLSTSSDPAISRLIQKICNIRHEFSLTDPGKEDLLLKLKFRGLDPSIRTGQEPASLTTLHPPYLQEFNNTKACMEKGWAIALHKLNH